MNDESIYQYHDLKDKTKNHESLTNLKNINESYSGSS